MLQTADRPRSLDDPSFGRTRRRTQNRRNRPLQYGRPCAIFSDHGLAEPVGCDKDDVGDLLEELEGHQRFDLCAVAALGPGPVEIAQGFEPTDMSLSQAPLE